jgi:Cu2+-exporting ATPase
MADVQREPTCFHCGLPAPAPAVEGEVDGHARRFCCPGCQAVCVAIHAAGLEGFYTRMPSDRPLAPPPTQTEDPAIFDLADVQAEFVRRDGDGLAAELLVEGIHCAACVWLIERHLGQMPGVRGVQVNLAARRLNVRWDPQRVALSGLLKALAGIGYAALPYDVDAVEGRLQRTQRARLYRLGFAAFAMMNLLWISIALYTGADRGSTPAGRSCRGPGPVCVTPTRPWTCRSRSARWPPTAIRPGRCSSAVPRPGSTSTRWSTSCS